MKKYFINRKNSVLVVVDVQERFLPYIDRYPEICKKIGILIEAANKLGIPVVVTEQYPKGLGPTAEEISKRLQDMDPIEKDTFSCCGEKRFNERIRSLGKTHLIVVGIESHVCVLQTVLDLIGAGYNVHLPQDAVGSRHPDDRCSALGMMRDAGAVMTCTESIVFQLLERSGTQEFKEIQKLVK